MDQKYKDFLLPQSIFNRQGHCKTYLRYHIIFVTKYRRKCLSNIKDDVFVAFRYVEDKSDITIHTMKNLEDYHIHLIVSFPVKYSISQTISRLKELTTNYIYGEKEHVVETILLE